MGRWTKGAWLWAAWALGCGDSKADPPGMGLLDAGMHTPEDGAAPEDDAAEPTEPDGGTGTGAQVCKESAPRFSAPFRPDGRGFDVVLDRLAVHLVYAEATCTSLTGDALGHRLRYAQFDTSGEVPEPMRLDVVGEGLCAKVRDPSLVLAETGVIFHFLSTRDGPWELYRANADFDITPLSDSATTNVMTHLAAGSDGAGGAFALAAEQDAHTRLDAFHGMDVAAWLEESAALDVVALALGTRADGTSRLPVAAFLASGAAPGLYVLPLGADLALPALPGPRKVAVGTGPAISIAPGLSGGALVYTEGGASGEQLRFVALDADGAPAGAARKLTTGNERIRDPSVAAYVSGFAVAYRVLKSDAPERATLRLAFVDAVGNLAGFRDVLETSAAGGPVVLRGAVDGRLVLAFGEVDEAGAYSLEVARVTCGRDN